MKSFPANIRRMVQSRARDKQLCDQVLMGYHYRGGTFWLASVDSRGEIDHEFAESMPPESYSLLMTLVRRLAAHRGGHVSAELVMAALNSPTLQ